MGFRYFLYVLFFISYAHATSAQVEDSVWIVTGDRYLGESFKKWRPELIFDARRTTVAGDASRLGGLRIGMEYKRVHRFGLGVYGLDNAIVRYRTSEDPGVMDTLAFNFSYATLFYERVLWFHPKWEWTAAMHLGSGTIESVVVNFPSDHPDKRELIAVKPTEISTSGYYNITWWLSAGGGLGYRFMRKTPTEVRGAYNGFVYIAKVKLKIGKLVKSIFNEEVKNEY